MSRPLWGTQTRQGHTCFAGLQSRAAAERLAREWGKRFPDYAPYAVTANAAALALESSL